MIYNFFKHPMIRGQFLFLVAILVKLSAGQDAANDSLPASLMNAKDDYYRGEYQKTISLLENTISSLTNGSRLEAHKYLTFSYARLGQSERSSQHFRQVFKIDPRWKMDPEDSSPEIDPILVATKKDRAQEAGMCSCFIPGIGQIMKGEEKKGLILLSATSATLAMSISSWIITDNRRRDYLKIGLNDTLRMSEAYHRYNDWYHLSLASTALFVGVYAYGIYDAFFPGSDYLSTQLPRDHGIMCMVDRSGWQMGYKIRF